MSRTLADSAHAHAVPLRVITHNIRFDQRPPSHGEAPWQKRLPLLASHFHYHSRNLPSTILCVQEALHNQVQDLQCSLNNLEKTTSAKWKYLGVGRDDGKQKGEACAIFFRSDAFVVEDWETVWLSEHPRLPGSKGWDAASVRVCTVALLRELTSQRDVVVLNTHLDDQGIESRFHAAKMIVQLVHRWVVRPGGNSWRPVIVTGDLNSEETGRAYKVLAEEHGLLRDAKYLCDERARYGEQYTFTGFQDRDEDKQKLDYIFVGAAAKGDSVPWHVDSYAVLPNAFEDKLLHSDHRAVVVDLLLR